MKKTKSAKILGITFFLGIGFILLFFIRSSLAKNPLEFIMPSEFHKGVTPEPVSKESDHHIKKEIFYNEKGQISSVRQYDYDAVYCFEYEYNADNLLISVKTDEPDASAFGHIYEEFVYNENGLLTEHYRLGELVEKQIFDADGNCLYDCKYSKGEPYSYISTEYINGYLASRRSFTYDYADGEKECIEEFNPDGSISKITYYGYEDEPYCEVFSYSDSKEEIRTYYLDGEEGMIEVILFDQQGRKTLQTSYFPDGSIFSSYKYEHLDNQVTQYTYSRKTNDYIIHSVDTYDLNERLIREDQYDDSGTRIVSFLYEYDSFGNQTVIEKKDWSTGFSTFSHAPEREYFSDGTIKKETFFEDTNCFISASSDSIQEIISNSPEEQSKHDFYYESLADVRSEREAQSEKIRSDIEKLQHTEVLKTKLKMVVIVCMAALSIVLFFVYLHKTKVEKSK